MDNVVIPPEAVEELRHCVRRVTGTEITPLMAEDIAAAMLNAWPHMSWQSLDVHPAHYTILLPTRGKQHG